MQHAAPLLSRALAATLALVLTLAVVVWAPAPADAQSGEVSVTATVESDGPILAGEDLSFTVRAAGSGAWGYNLAVVVRVPVGVAPVASEAGLPRVVADPADPATHQLWIWEDLADLPAGGVYELDVTARPSQPPAGGGQTGATDVFPVGATVDLVASTYVSTDPALLPDFPGTSAVDPGASAPVTVGGSASHAVDIEALRVAKTEPSPEAELVRGVHDHTTEYRVEIENTTEGTTADAQLVDWIPAGLEFLGCGGLDATTVDRAGDGSGDEYPGSGDLTGTPIVDPMGAFVGGARDGCLVPSEVVTVVGDPDAPTGGVFTKVTWDLGDLPAGSMTELRYRAAVPLYANTVEFDGVDGAPTGESLDQTANLDNNNGPSTRHSEADGSPEDGTVWRNLAQAAGTYAGVVRTGTSREVTDQDDEFVHAMDLAVVKTSDEDQFDAGGTAAYSLELRTSEYTSAGDIVLTDRLPNGLCPLLPTDVAVTGDALPEGCELADSHPSVTGANATAVDFDAAAGEFTLTLVPDPATLSASATHVVTYPVRMRASYTDAGEYGPTTSLDDFVNDVEVQGVTTSIAALATWFPDDEDVWDDSEAVLGSEATRIAKRVAPRESVVADLPDGSDPCPAAGYVDDAATGFRFGDTACFELTVTFPTSIATRNPVVTDVLPSTLDLVGWAAADPASEALLAPDAFVADGRRLEWRVGPEGAGGDRYVDPGAVLTLHVWTSVAAPSAGPAVDKPENLMKFRQENVEGEVFFLRDQAVIDVEPGISLVKGVEDVDGETSRPAQTQAAADGAAFGSDRDGIVVREGEEVRYRVDLVPATYAVEDVEVWDSLPAGIACADVSSTAPAATCFDPGDAGFPVGLTGPHASRSVLVWTGQAVAAAPAAGTTLGYTVTVPAGTSVSTRHVNTASVIAYASGTNASSDPAEQAYLPAGSLDTSRSDDWNVPGELSRDDSAIVLPDAVVTKTATTDVDDAAGYNTAEQTVTGELITYTYGVTVPANTTIHDGVLSDALPTGLVQHGAPSATFDDGLSGPAALPAGFTLDADGTLRFPTSYDNTTAEDHRFEVTLQTYLADGHPRVHGANLGNTARFAANRSVGGTALPVRQATATVRYVEPDPAIAKRVSAIDGDAVTGPPPLVAAGERITYDLTVTNAASRPTSFDTVVTDCVPEELVFDAYATPPAGATTIPAEPGDGTNGCAIGDTRLAWSLGAVAAGDRLTLSYDVVVGPAAGGRASYVNEAEVVGYTLPENPDSGDRGTVDDDTTATVEVVGAGVTKSVTPTTATVGESVDYTVTTTLPANVNFYDARIDDEVPAGIAVTDATCTSSDPSVTCTAPEPATTPGTGSATLTWELGDVLAAPAERQVAITYTGTVVATAASTPADLDPVAGDQLANVAELSWATLAGGTERRDVSDDAVVTVVEPELVIDKLVDDEDHQDLAPGDGFGYAVEVGNVGTSTAYDVVVTDEVPLGVVVDAATISGDGVLTGADAVRGGGTITWALDTLAVGPAATVTFTYEAALAPSGDLDGATLDNVAAVGTYASTADPDDDRRTYTGPSDDAAVTPSFPSVTVVKDVVDGDRVGRVGDAFPWDLTVTNTGAATAHDVVVTDELPHGWEAGTTTSVTIDGVAILPTPQAVVDVAADGRATLTWTIDELAAGEVAAIRFDSTPTTDAYAAPGAGVGVDNLHVNTVTVTAEDGTGAEENADGPYGGDPDDADAFLEATNVAITKTRAAGEVRVGDEVTFTLTASNTGDQPAEDVVVTDALPAGLTFAGVDDPVAADDTVWDCAVLDGTLTCALLDALPAGDGAALTVTARVLADAAPSVTNLAEVTTSTPQTDVDDDEDDAEVPVTPVADLRLLKGIDGPSTVVAGERLTWTIDVRNLGPSTSVAPITVVDTLPAGLSDIQVTAPGWTCGEVEDLVLTCVLGSDLALDADAPRIEVDASIDPSADATLTNRAVVSATTEDPEEDNDADEVATDEVDAVADLALTKSLASDELAAGTTGRYRLAVSNAGPSDARNVTVDDQLPPELTFLGGVTSADGDDWACADLGSDEVACELRSDAGTLPAGGSTWFEFDVAVAASATGTVRNVATVSTTTEDPDPSDDRDDEETELTVTTNLAVTKSHDALVHRIDDEVTFTVQVTNEGPADATEVVVVDTLPDGLTFADVATPIVAGDDWDCLVDVAEGTLRCELGRDLLADVDQATEELAVTARVTADAYPDATNVVAITTGTEQTTLEDDTAEDEVVVAPLVDLEVVKDLEQAELEVGGTGTYLVTVTNHGPTADPGPITLVDVLPEGLSYVAHDGATCAVDGRQLDCELGALAVDASVDIRIEVAVEPAAYPEVTNAAEVSTPSEDTDPDDDHDDDTAPVRPDIAFSLTKELTDVDGDRLTWTLTAANTGRNVAEHGFTIRDPLPSGLEFVSASGDGFDCSLDGREVRCEFAGALAAGASATLSLVTDVSAAPGETVTNLAYLEAEGYDVEVAGVQDEADHRVPDDPEAPAAPPAGTATPPTSGRGRLPFTGAPGVVQLVTLAGALLALGAVLARRRRNDA